MAHTYTLLQQPSITAELITTTDTLAYETPLQGQIVVTSQHDQQAFLPTLNDRFQGFETIELFETKKQTENQGTRQVWRFRLTAKGEGPWRLMPFVLSLQNKQTGQLQKYATQCITFTPPAPLPEAAGPAECTLTPQWIWPNWKTFALWIGMGILVIGLLFACYPLLKKVRRTLYERTLSPEERARLEMDRLLQAGLLQQGNYQTFYVELTLIVRRYYERSYHIRASRQTTQEFLAKLVQDDRFEDDQRKALSTFLEASDCIKFAGVAVTTEESTAAAHVATETIEQDAKKRAEQAQLKDAAK